MFLKLKYTFILFFIIMSFFSNFNQYFISNNSYIYPTTSRNISSNFGYRILFGKTNFHDGIDFAIPNGSPIYATNSGIIITSSFLNGYGNSIIIKHYDGNKSLYGHLSENFIVQNGDSVEQGELIGYVGPKYLSNGTLNGNTTGPHLHFTIIGINGNFINPSELID